MSNKAIPGVCPNCGKEGLIVEEQIRDHTDWQIKYGVECQFCGYRFKVDKKTFDDLLSLSRNKKQA
jgi:DNA-directed RNA polymerase subunit RPC12/RpoP